MPVGTCKTPGDECSAAARPRGKKSHVVLLLLQLCSGLRVVCVRKVNTPVRSRRMWDKLLRALSAVGRCQRVSTHGTIVCCTGQRAVAVEHDLDREASVGKCGYFYFHHLCAGHAERIYMETFQQGGTMPPRDKEERTADAANRRRRRPARKQEAGANLSRLL